MQLKEKSRYLMIDPDSEGDAKREEKMQFGNVLDLFEYELN